MIQQQFKIPYTIYIASIQKKDTFHCSHVQYPVNENPNQETPNVFEINHKRCIHSASLIIVAYTIHYLLPKK